MLVHKVDRGLRNCSLLYFLSSMGYLHSKLEQAYFIKIQNGKRWLVTSRSLAFESAGF